MANSGLVLFIEDDAAVRLGSTQALQIAGYEVRAFPTAEQVLPHLHPGVPAVVVTDVKLPGMDGLELLERAQRIDANLPVVLVTGHGDISMAVQAMRDGAYDFVEKPYSSEQITEVVRRALEKRNLSLEVMALRGQVENMDSIEARIIGRSPAVRNLRKLILNVSSTDADVLICGETGTGKELVAQCLHDFSPRKAKPFAALNCGGMPETLFESEVFGHEAGSFTGAVKRRVGKMEHAAGGTLFLDEIETMPVSLQVKMLRALQERRFERLGSNELLPMNCRIIAATKSDLLNPAPEQPFRQDLYYRLSVVVLTLPPLRERREDIPMLLSHFLMKASLRYSRPVPEVSDARMNELLRHAWPGNVRELSNVADRIVLGLPMGRDSLPLEETARSMDEQLVVFERYLIEEAMRVCSGRAALASDRLGIPKKTLYDKMKRLGISVDDFKPERED